MLFLCPAGRQDNPLWSLKQGLEVSSPISVHVKACRKCGVDLHEAGLLFGTAVHPTGVTLACFVILIH